ncbi:hypothetical protein ACLK2H_15790 [Escherichia coli]
MQEAAVGEETKGQETIGKVANNQQAGAPKVAGLLRNEPGALFLQCSLFLFLLSFAAVFLIEVAL